MYNKSKKVILLFIVFLFLATFVSAYNGKFAFKLKSGWMSHWIYSDYAYKYTDNESPVVGVTYTDGSTDNFIYTVCNSDNQDRVTPFSKRGTFKVRAFDKHIMVKKYKYKLGIRRDGGAWNTEASTQGLWNPDSY